MAGRLILPWPAGPDGRCSNCGAAVVCEETPRFLWLVRCVQCGIGFGKFRGKELALTS